MEVTVYRKAHFNAAHRLFNKNWTDEKNETVFGPCSNPFFHGHNYELIISVTGPVDQETGFVIDLSELKFLISQHITSYLDHKNLNEQIDEFKILNPTAENIALVIYTRLRPHLNKALKMRVKLYETARNFVECGD